MVVFREKRKHVCIHQPCCHDDFHNVTHFEDNTTLHTHRLSRPCRISRASRSITTWSLHDPSGIRRLGHAEESLDQFHSLITGERLCPNRRRICLRMLQSHVYEGRGAELFHEQLSVAISSVHATITSISQSERCYIATMTYNSCRIMICMRLRAVRTREATCNHDTNIV